MSNTKIRQLILGRIRIFWVYLYFLAGILAGCVFTDLVWQPKLNGLMVENNYLKGEVHWREGALDEAETWLLKRKLKIDGLRQEIKELQGDC